MKYGLDNKNVFCSIIVLDQLANGKNFMTDEGTDAFQSFLKEMQTRGLLDLTGYKYAIAPKGQELLDNFYKKYDEFLKVYDIYCAVDLKEGVFAFQKYYDFDTDEEWQKYLQQSNWEDVRIAVAEFKKIDPVEIVFLSFLNENRFNLEDGLEFKLLDSPAWDEILEICNSAIHVEDLMKDDAIHNIVEQGSSLMRDLLNYKLEDLRNQDETEEEIVEEITIVEEEIEYYDPYYYDIYYVSPCWVWYWYW